METFHRLAGVQDPSPHDAQYDNEHAPQPVHDASQRVDNEDTFASNRASRVSLPLNQKQSQRTLGHSRETSYPDGVVVTPTTGRPPSLPSQRADRRSSYPRGRRSRDTHGSHDDNATENEVAFAWGPTHPCFPHPNPHCHPDSDEARTTRVIRIRRDWLYAGDRCPQFANLYPEILDPWVSVEDFRHVISNLNKRLESAFDPMTANAWIDAVLGVATGFFWDDLGFTAAKRKMKGIEAFVKQWNADKAREQKDVRLVPLKRTGFMSLDFVIPDPEVEIEHSIPDERSEHAARPRS